MSDELFYKLWQDALSQPDKELFIEEYGYPDWFDEISLDPAEVLEILGNIHDVAHISFKSILQRANLTQKAFSHKFCIPVRSIENWSAGIRECASYQRLAFCRQLGILERRSDVSW